MKLLDGTYDSVQFQLGANRAEDVNLSIRSVAAGEIGTYRVEAVSYTHLTLPTTVIV